MTERHPGIEAQERACRSLADALTVAAGWTGCIECARRDLDNLLMGVADAQTFKGTSASGSASQLGQR